MTDVDVRTAHTEMTALRPPSDPSLEPTGKSSAMFGRRFESDVGALVPPVSEQPLKLTGIGGKELPPIRGYEHNKRVDD